MRSAILNVTFDCGDAAALARFWSGVTRWPAARVEMPGNPFWLVARDGDDGVRMVFVEVPEGKVGKNRVHLDLRPAEGSQEEEVARLEAMGARILDDRRNSAPGGWVVMADPEGNEFCLEQGD
jgi:predicted enzyme related to lactoylglutathione lyase